MMVRTCWLRSVHSNGVPFRWHRSTLRRRTKGFRPVVTFLEDRCLPAVSLGTQFLGLDSGQASGTPPDTIVAAGPTHIVEAINSSLAFFNKSTGAIVGSPQ